MPTDHPIVIFGKNGQVGSALCNLLGDKAIGFSRAQANLSHPDTLLKPLDGLSPKAIINAAAYTAVDKAEEESELAYKINAEAPGVLAQYCKEHDIPLVHYSTDYVFSGEGSTPHKEDDAANPLNLYGKSKLAGEKEITRTGCKHLILRTSWVYDAHHKNFITTMLKLAKEREKLTIVSDQIGAPTYAPHLAENTLDVLTNALNNKNYGTFHLCGSGQTNWYEFACTFFDLARKQGIGLAIKDVQPIPTSAYPTPAKRPLNSRLDCSRIKAMLGVQMPDWQDSLKACMEHVR